MDDRLHVIYKVVATSNECSLTNKPKPKREVSTLGTGIFRCTNAPCVGPSRIISTRPFTRYLSPLPGPLTTFFLALDLYSNLTKIPRIYASLSYEVRKNMDFSK
jgi:hypothetical protein